jgi:hypothetical protein
MIEIPQPALALNSADFGPSDHYRMQFNHVVPRSWSVQAIADAIGTAMTAAGSLRALVVNAHGMCGPDGVALGTGLHIGSVAPLLMFRGSIERVYLCACQVADTGNGYEFCRFLAMRLNAPVVASKEPQVVTTADRAGAGRSTADLGVFAYGQVPENCIDNFEGTTYEFQPDGGRVDWRGNSA